MFLALAHCILLVEPDAKTLKDCGPRWQQDAEDISSVIQVEP